MHVTFHKYANIYVNMFKYFPTSLHVIQETDMNSPTYITICIYNGKEPRVSIPIENKPKKKSRLLPSLKAYKK